VAGRAARIGLAGGRGAVEHVEQLPAVDERRRGDGDRDADDEHDAERQQRGDIGAEPAQQQPQVRLAAALLRPRRSEEADGEHRLDHRRDEHADQRERRRRRGAARSSRTACMIHGKPMRAEHPIALHEPQHAAAAVVARECDVVRQCVASRSELERRARSGPRARRMRSNGSGSCACVSSPGRGR
jgi:hypothetical protein